MITTQVFDTASDRLSVSQAVSELVTTVPLLVWLSMHNAWVFSLAAVLLVSGLALCAARSLPCRADPVVGRQSARLRVWSVRPWWTALIAMAIDALFAFVLPALR